MQLTILNRQRSHPVHRPALGAFLGRVARRVPPSRPANLALCLVSDRRMRELNRRYRGHDSTTDVLAFPGDVANDIDERGESHLGDILISVPTAASQARRAGHSLPRELKILALHGYLHLVGYDHETDDGAMLRLQGRLIRRLLPRPAIARGRRDR